MDQKRNAILSLVATLAIVLVGCGPAEEVRITPPSPTSTAARAASPLPTRTQTARNSPLPTESPTATLPLSTPSFIGTPVPGGNPAIGMDNYLGLTHVAQWGRGTILGTAFTPDGSKVVAGSAFGFAIYDAHQLQTVPIWVPFEEPTDYQGFSFSRDGNYILLKGPEQVRGFPDGQVMANPPNPAWTDTVVRSVNWGEITAYSPDGTKRLHSKVERDENYMDYEYSIREVYDTGSDKLLYKLPDETFYLRYNDIHDPEGCDLSSTAMCGNVFTPSAFHPYEAAFSPTGNTLTILYRAPNYWNYNRFSVLRIYDARNGKLMDMVGNFDRPIQTFGYSPDGTRLVIANVDGSLQLWDIQRNQPVFDAWHFNDYLWYVEFTSDGRFLLLQRPDALEVRSTQDGSLRSRFAAVAYALSPADSNLLAVADTSNAIKIIEIDSGRTVLSFPAHDFRIFTIAFSPDGRYIASASQDCKVKLWDAQTGEFIHYFEDTRVNGYMGGPPIPEDPYGNSRIFIKYLEFLRGTDRIVGFGSWGTVVVWSVNSGATEFAIYSAPLEFYNGMMTVSPHYPDSFGADTSNDQLYIGNKMYDMQTGAELGEFQPPENLPKDCAPGGPISVDGNLFFAIGYDSREGQVCVLDAHDNHMVYLITLIPHPDADLTVAGLSLSQDGKSLIIATTMGTVDVYRITR